MAAPLTRDASGTPIRYDADQGAWRPLNADELGSIQPRDPVNEFGADESERIKVKWLARNPALGLSYLKSIPSPTDPSKPKYEVYPYGHGFNYALRPYGSQEPFKLLDPGLSASPAEFLRDIVDVLGDVGQGLATGAGAVTGAAAAGPVGAVAGGAAAAGGAELLRQSLGEAAGIKGNVAPLGPEMAAQTIAGGLAEPLGAAVGALGSRVLTPAVQGVGRAIGRTVPPIRKITEEAVGKLLTIRPLAGLDIGQTVLERADRMTNGTFDPLPTPSMAVQWIRDHLEAAREGSGSIVGRLSAMRDSVVQQAQDAGVKVDLTGLRPALLRAVGEGVKFHEPNIPGDPATRDLMAQINTLLTPPTREQANDRVRDAFLAGGRPISASNFDQTVNAVYNAAARAHAKFVANADPTLATGLLERMGVWLRNARSAFQSSATDANAAPSTVTRETIAQVERLYGRLADHIKGTLDSQGYGAYRDLQADVAEKLNAHRVLRDIFGTRSRPATTAEGAVINGLRSGKGDLQQAVLDYDNAFSKFAGKPIADAPNFAGTMHDVGLGLQFTPEGTQPIGTFGQPRYLPTLGATGAPRVAGLLGSVSAPTVIGGVAGLPFGPAGVAVGAGTGAAAAAVLGSPRMIVRAAPYAVKAANAAQRTASVLASRRIDFSAAARLSAASLQIAAREAMATRGKGVTVERAKPRRRMDLTY